MVRGLDCRAILHDDRDRRDFILRLAAPAQARTLNVSPPSVRDCFARRLQLLKARGLTHAVLAAAPNG